MTPTTLSAYSYPSSSGAPGVFAEPYAPGVNAAGVGALAGLFQPALGVGAAAYAPGVLPPASNAAGVREPEKVV